MLNLNILIINNQFAKITENSIRKNMPGVGYEVIQADIGKYITTALHEAEGKMSFVVLGGVVLELKAGDFPPLATLEKYHLCAPRMGIYTDHPRFDRFYKYIGSDLTKSHIDTSVFIINPNMWGEFPKSDNGCLRDKKVLYMPRYMDHKNDPVVKTCVSPYQALQYGMLGDKASVFNYISNIATGEASVIERYAYRFDKYAPYLEGVDDEIADPIRKLIAKDSINKFREKLSKIQGIDR